MINVSDKICRESSNTYSTFFEKIHAYRDDVEKYFSVRQATMDNMAQAHCTRDN